MFLYKESFSFALWLYVLACGVRGQPSSGSNPFQGSWNDDLLARRLGHNLAKGVFPWRWSSEAREAYNLETQLEKRETIGYQSATPCTTPKVPDYRHRNRTYFIESAKLNLQMNAAFCMSRKFLSCQAGRCECQDPVNLFWDSGIEECVLPPSACRGFGDPVITKNRILTVDVSRPEAEAWKIPHGQGRRCPEKTPFCANLGIRMTTGFLFEIQSSGDVYDCLHCDLETIQIALRQKMKLQHDQKCNMKHQAVLFDPKPSARTFENRLESLHLLSTDARVEFCQFNKFLTCNSTNATISPTCQCLPGLFVDGNGACVKTQLYSVCGTTSVASAKGSPLSSAMVIPEDWRLPVKVTCLPAGGKSLRCARMSEIDSTDTCSCPEGLFGPNCEVIAGNHLKGILRNPAQLPYNPTFGTPQASADILDRLSASLTKFEPQLSIGPGQECDLENEFKIEKVWAFLMHLFNLKPESPRSDRLSYWSFEQVISLIVNKTGNGKTYCSREPGARFNNRCRPKGGSTIKGTCRNMEYASVHKIEQSISNFKNLRVIPTINQTESPSASSCNEAAEKLLMGILQRNLRFQNPNYTEIMLFYDSILDLKEQIKPSSTAGNPIVPSAKSFCSSDQGVACVANICQCRKGYEWYADDKQKCLVSHGAICERCHPGHASVYLPCSPPQECIPLALCTMPFYVPFTKNPDDPRYFTKYCHYNPGEMPVPRRANIPEESATARKKLSDLWKVYLLIRIILLLLN